MKLYFSPGACSLSPHIALREAGLPVELVRVNLANKRTNDDRDFKTINPKGYVPALQLDDGQVLTEGLAIVQYIADQRPSAKLAPPAGTLEGYRLQEWLTFIATELHKGFSPLWNPKAPEEWKRMVKERLAERFDFLQEQLRDRRFLLGDAFTVADGYAFTVLRWSKGAGIELGKWPGLLRYVEEIGKREAVRAALQAEEEAR
jgi:glutathione S-transferase